MRLRTDQINYILAVGFIASLLLHIFIYLGLYLPHNWVVIIMTSGIILSWLYSSRIMRQHKSEYPEGNPWVDVLNLIPVWLKYFTYMIIVYSFINFISSMSFSSGGGYINTDVSAVKIRGLSGFWLAFYAIGFSLGIGSVIHNKNKIENIGSGEKTEL
ncbi:MAG: hypothetical protein AB7T22_08990 [Calditrichaceae bacterium]